LISIDRIVGNENSNTTVRLIVPERFAHVAYGGKNLFIPPKGEVEKPTYHILFFADEALKLTSQSRSPREISLSDWLCWMTEGLSR